MLANMIKRKPFEKSVSRNSIWTKNKKLFTMEAVLLIWCVHTPGYCFSVWNDARMSFINHGFKDKKGRIRNCYRALIWNFHFQFKTKFPTIAERINKYWSNSKIYPSEFHQSLRSVSNTKSMSMSPAAHSFAHLINNRTRAPFSHFIFYFY